MQSKDKLGKRPKSRPSAFVDILDEQTKVAKSLLFFVAAKPIHLDKKMMSPRFSSFFNFFCDLGQNLVVARISPPSHFSSPNVLSLSFFGQHRSARFVLTTDEVYLSE